MAAAAVGAAAVGVQGNGDGFGEEEEEELEGVQPVEEGGEVGQGSGLVLSRTSTAVACPRCELLCMCK